MPASCSNEDVKDFFISLTGHENVDIDSKKCQIKEPSKLSSIDLIFGWEIFSSNYPWNLDNDKKNYLLQFHTLGLSVNCDI